jgi:hypothetical protein
MIVEVRTYRLQPGRAEEFVRLMRAEGLPLLARYGITVLDCALSLDPDGEPQADAYLIRAFASRAEREAREGEFYARAAWNDGPRPAVLALIESHHTVVLDLPAEPLAVGAAAGLRVGVPAPPPGGPA